MRGYEIYFRVPGFVAASVGHLSVDVGQLPLKPPIWRINFFIFSACHHHAEVGQG